MEFRYVLLTIFLLAIAFLIEIGMFARGYAGEPTAAVIDMREATGIVLAEFPNARIVEIELDREDGRLVYEVELVTPEGREKEVHVDAVTGRLVKVEHD